jgi:hypothetical protein
MMPAPALKPDLRSPRPRWAKRAIAHGVAADAFVRELIEALEKGEDIGRARAAFVARLALMLDGKE